MKTASAILPSLGLRACLAAGTLLSAGGLLLPATAGPEAASLSADRIFDFTYEAVVTPPAGASRVRIWVPVPTSGLHQTIESLKVESPLPHKVERDEASGNAMAYLEAKGAALAKEIPVKLTFRVLRREDAGKPSGATLAAAERERCLKGDALAPVDGERIETLKVKVVRDAKEPAKVARAVYDHVLAHMTYDKSGKGWGRGDLAYVCDIGRGNCTDFHALFISLMRASGVPARFEIGFPLPAERGAGEVKGYHCWAHYWEEGRGWVPVDGSEADKEPALAEYYFGHHGTNRVRFTTGRDLMLSPRQDGPPLNFFIYPYVEVDGKPADCAAWKFAFKDILAGR